MNAPVVRIYVLFLLLFGSLVYFTSKWAVLDAESLQDRPQNRRPLIAEQQIPRGTITTSDGVLVAESLAEGEGSQPVFVRRYPADDPATFGNPIGYSFVEIGRTGVELGENDLLSGEQNEFASIVDQLRAVPPEGADITLTLDAAAQRLAVQLLQGAVAPGVGGSVVALDPETGAVKVMASIPGFDPNTVSNSDTFSELSTDQSAPLVNRPTQSVYQPGSTMKVVTATAALDSGEFDPDTVLNADSGKRISGFPLENSGSQDFGDIDMTAALTNSVNTYWAQVGERLGQGTMVEYMKRFGFYSDPELDYPDAQMIPSGVYNSAGDPVEEGFDVGRVAIGQGGEEGQASTTPLQMAEVAAAVANGGELMQPNLLQEAKDPDGRTISELDPDTASDVMSDETAAQVTEMMVNVTEEGTAAGLSVGGVSFAGKTGTAEIDVAASINRPWFIGFAPADDPQVAVAAMIEKCTGCTGGEVAGPIATQVMQSLLDG
ncbi:MAG: peptidoglycan D,D-transpeptidase FtsI family protein [Solirubrobacterales bacterium]